MIPPILVALTLGAAACNRGGEAGTTTITAQTLDTLATTPRNTTTSQANEETSESSTSVPGIPGYTIVSRSVGGEGDGDMVVVVLENTQESYTPLDIKNVVDDLIERFAPIWEAHVVGSQEAAEAVIADDPTPQQRQELEDSYFAHLQEANRLVYQGPFQDEEEIIIGS